MRTLNKTLAVMMLLAAPLASAQPEQLCRDNLTQDRQPNFSDSSLDRGPNDTILITPETPPRLQLNTNLTVLNVENITFPFDQRVTISYVYESAGASHALGYMYLDDLQKKPTDPATKVEYVNAAGNLVDSNNNGIFDLHEDIYNLAPPSGPKARPYVGVSRRCTETFTDTAGETYSEPDIARRNCGNTFQRILTTHPTLGNRIADARPGQTFNLIDADVVGSLLGGTNASATQFSDGGLFPHIPNILEPPAIANGNKGVGKMVFLLADDDGDQGNGATFGNLAPVPDSDFVDDGVPDYDVSAYDARGLPRATNPNAGISAFDRTVDLGMVEGGKEIIFFLIVFYDSNHRPNEGTVFPCLKQDAAGKCLLHLRTPINVYFSKAAWNIDQNSEANPVVAERNIGCSYDSTCDRDNPTSNSCHIGNGGPRLCGWLDGPKTTVGTTLHRLRNDAAYGFLDMPMERVTVPRPAGTRNPMPHVIVGAPSTDPFRWILGFEDLPGGGDRDFNDVVFVINKENGGNMRSATVSGDISPSIADDFVITKVRFKRQDDAAPAPRTCTGSAPCWTEETPGACTPPNGARPSIRYSLAVDCRVCSNGTCTKNETPTWFPLEFPNTTPPTQQVEVDILSLGFTGSQLCWKVDISSPNERCRPIVDNIDVGYQAVRAGSYARASPSTLGNAIVWGVNETPGSAWGDDWPGTGLPAASTRAYDGKKDFSLRGRLYFRSLYDPETPTATNVVQRWDAGQVMAMALRTGANPTARTLYTTTSPPGPTSTRATITSEMQDTDSASPLFPDALCDVYANGRYTWDLNNDGKCGTPTGPPDKNVTGPTNDRNFFREWLYGWEDQHTPAPSNVKRPWPMGGINLSTVAMAVPPYLDTWAQNTRPEERDAYRKNFLEPLATRDTVAYVGTMNGFLHAYDAGAFRNATDDACTTGAQLRGFFEPSGSCATPTPRDYGTGEEKFAYLPNLMLEHYRNLYVQVPSAGTPPPKPQVDASPTIANVDLGIAGQPKWTPSPVLSKTTGAKTVLVSSTGKGSPAVFALDITNPADAWYPLPLWEFNLRDTNIDLAFTLNRLINPSVLHPDNTGSRHAPSVARLAWGSGSTTAWTAVVGSDYKPVDTARAGAVYLIDMKTGRPLNYGSSPGGQLAGIITLEQGVGVAAESALVDLNRDGNYDIMYVPTTNGGVYRVNLDQVSTSAPLGRKVKTCKIASAPASLTDHPDAATGPNQDPFFQQLYSNLAVKVVRDTTNPTVRIYFGTGDNPDEFSDGPANKNTYRYHLLAFEDTDPTGEESCELLEPLWVQQLDPGQTVWGGVALSSDRVFATTAVGRSADVCGLSQDESGKYYATGQLPDEDGSAPDMSSASLDGHGINAPVVHDQHLFVLTATGKMKMVGDDNWNTGAESNGAVRSRILIYDAIPDGRMPR
ncbi:DUF4114 domain-containing protein [Pyxidicoccus xibeiensis]|uniref:DUF4114 domain-containing protein n=1 Tax=Pyxidicoccus xibeiensis TaxID=2906759 RepID=UPI0020A6FBA7|nr:DUF4114 domain-containing protein [Pyxidicoccus xibeiensis]MCP3136545.1 DUF4114 domain-containing protein [Pyxidicoccus xibeiensis]